MSVKALFTTNRFKLQLVRSLLMVATTAFNFMALRYLRLDQTITIVFLAPLMVALLAGPLLGEWVGWRRLVAILVGFAGILIVVRPGVGGVHPAVIISLVGMLAYALFMLLTRYLAAFDPPLVTLFYSMFAGTIGAAPLAYRRLGGAARRAVVGAARLVSAFSAASATTSSFTPTAWRPLRPWRRSSICSS